MATGPVILTEGDKTGVVVCVVTDVEVVGGNGLADVVGDVEVEVGDVDEVELVVAGLELEVHPENNIIITKADKHKKRRRQRRKS